MQNSLGQTIIDKKMEHLSTKKPLSRKQLHVGRGKKGKDIWKIKNSIKILILSVE